MLCVSFQNVFLFSYSFYQPQSVYTTIPAHGCELEFEDGKVTFPSPPEPNLTIKTPVIQTFENPDMKLGGIKYRVEKVL